MYTLQRDQRFSLHPEDYALRVSDRNDRIANLARLAGSWDGNGVGVIFVDRFNVTRENERWWQFDLITGIAEPVALTPGNRPIRDTTSFEVSRPLADPYQRTPYGLEPGQAFIQWKRGGRPPIVRVEMEGNRPMVVNRFDVIPGISGAEAMAVDNVTVYIDRWFAEDDPDNDDLDVARDALFAHDMKRAKIITERTIPHSFELWLACIKRELGLLTARTNAAVPMLGVE
jgi:hypothetical protein